MGYKILTIKEKANIFYKYSCGISRDNISKELNMPNSLIMKCLKLWKINRNLSESHIGKPNKSRTKFVKGQVSPNKGKKLHYKVWNKGIKTGIKPKSIFKKGHSCGKRFIKGQPAINKGKPAPWAKGSNNINWKGGVSDENKKIRESEKYKNWRRDVFVRDQFTCQKCSHRFIKIVAHHIKSFSDYPDLRFDVNNGQTLCRSCHALVHKDDLLKARGLVYEYGI